MNLALDRHPQHGYGFFAQKGYDIYEASLNP